nr:putative ribonuclease H-like domain-containing protein [Tanacetum cinerariifolium]
TKGNPQQDLKDKGVIDNGCSKHMIGNKSYFTDYEDIDGGFVDFGGNSKGGKITRKGKIKTGKLDFEYVYFVKELKFNLFNVSQMCDEKNNVLFIDNACVVLSPDFKLTDESHVLFKVPKKDNMYSVDLKNVVPQGGLTCLFAKAISDESNIWHRRLGHVNFKTINKLVKGNLVRGLASKVFEINETCVACQKRKQHRASYKTKIDSSISQPLQMLHMDLFCPTFVKSLMKKMYCLVVTDDFSRKHALSFMRPFGCPFIIPNTLYHLCKFDEKADEGFFVGYSTNSKAFRVFNSRTRILKENLHVKYSENTPNIAGSRPNWIFNIEALAKSLNYKTVVTGNQSNGSAVQRTLLVLVTNHLGEEKKATEDPDNEDSKAPSTGEPRVNQEKDANDSPGTSYKPSGGEEKKATEDPENEDSKAPSTGEPRVNQEKDANVKSTNNINTVSSTDNDVCIKDNAVNENIVYGCADDSNMTDLEEIG